MNNQNQLVQQMPNIANQPAQINIKLLSGTRLTYNVPEQLGGGENSLLLVNDLMVSLPEGFNVKLSQNYPHYIVVHQYRNDVNNYPPNLVADNHRITLPIGTDVLVGIGIGFQNRLTHVMEVKILNNTKIKLQTNTSIQHIDVPIELILPRETEVTLDF